MKIHECVSFLLIDPNKQVLLEKRAVTKASDPGLVAIPGGHMEADETQQQTLVREIEEELGVQVTSGQHLCSLYHPTSELQLLHYYVVTQWQGTISAYEADSVFWSSIEAAPIDCCADKTALAEYQRLSSAGVI